MSTLSIRVGRVTSTRATSIGDAQQSEIAEQFGRNRFPLGLRQVHHLQNGEQIVLDRETLEDAGFLGEVSHTAPGALIHGQPTDVLPLEDDPAGIGRDHADGHSEGGGLAGAVLAEEAHDFRLVNRERNVINNLSAAVRLLESSHIEEFHVAAPYLAAEAFTRGAKPAP
jgi:hypothetical protein